MVENADRTAPETAGEERMYAERKIQRREIGFVLTPRMIQNFISYINEKGLKDGTIALYTNTLKDFYDDLPADKRVEKRTISVWSKDLLEKGFAIRTVNARISAVNAALEFWEYRDLQSKKFLSTEPALMPVITKSEYIRLLQMARHLEKEKIYLIIKLFVLTGVRSRDLSLLTFEQVQRGYAETEIGNMVESRYIPRCLREELLDFAKRNGITSGVLFTGSRKSDRPVNRSVINYEFHNLCKEARIPEEKGNVNSLRKLYEKTREEVERNFRLLIEQAYDQKAEKEQFFVAWQERGSLEFT